jgi:flagellar FliL protein
MAKTAPPQAAAETAATAKGGRSKLVLVIVPVLLALVAGWYFVLGPGSGGSSAEEKPKVEPGEVLALEPITMNLADGRLLKVGLALQLPLEPASGHGEVSGSVALDEAIAFLGEHTYAQLAAPGARQKAKQELSKRVYERYHHEVLEVYFTEFVMQ